MYMINIVINAPIHFFHSCPVIFDVHEFYGPDIVEMKLVQMLGLFSEEVADISIRMKDVLRGQEARLVQLHNKGAFENSDR